MDVLYVADDSARADATVATLEHELETGAVHRASTVTDALEACSAAPIGCVVVDVASESRALELLGRIRDREPDLPVILVSSEPSAAAVEEALAAGVTGYLPAGVPKRDELLARTVRNVLAERDTRRALLERTKELAAVAYTAVLLEDVERPIDDVLSEFVAFLPRSFRRPSSTAVRVVVGDREVTGEGFAPGDESIVAHTDVDDGTRVVLEVAVADDAVGDGDPFLEQERLLVETLCSLLTFHLERRTSRQRLELALEGAAAGIWEWNVETDAVSWDEHLERLFGLDPGAFEGSVDAFLEYVHPDDVAAVEDALADALERPGQFGFECRIVRADGTVRWLATRGTTVTDDAGTAVRMIGIGVDITERAERERQLQVVTHLLRHTVRNEMSVVRGHAEQVRDGDGDPDEHAAVLIETADRLLETTEKQRLIVDLLSGPPTREPTDVSALLARVTETVAARYPDADVDSDVDRSIPEGCRATAVPELEIALVELLENAIVHNDRAHPSVDVTADCEGGRVRIRIADDGPRIPEMETTVLTGERSIDQLSHGSGQGLWLVYWVVRRSDGTLTFDANEPRGNVVTVDLPCNPERD